MDPLTASLWDILTGMPAWVVLLGWGIGIGLAALVMAGVKVLYEKYSESKRKKDMRKFVEEMQNRRGLN